jgi:hypothetical protein
MVVLRYQNQVRMSIVRTPGQTIDPISESARQHVHGASCVLCATWRHSHGARQCDESAAAAAGHDAR